MIDNYNHEDIYSYYIHGHRDKSSTILQQNKWNLDNEYKNTWSSRVDLTCM